MTVSGDDVVGAPFYGALQDSIVVRVLPYLLQMMDRRDHLCIGLQEQLGLSDVFFAETALLAEERAPENVDNLEDAIALLEAFKLRLVDALPKDFPPK